MNTFRDSSPRDGIDRHVDRALQREPDAGPPADFARSVAARVAGAAATDARVERWLLRGLALAFACSALVVAALYGREWLAGFALLLSAAGATAMNWLLALLACVALSWSFERLRVSALRH